MALLIGPVGCLRGGKGSLLRTAWARSRWTLAAFTFFGRKVDAFAIAAQWMRPPESPGHVIEHGVIRPAEAAIIFIGLKPQPPLVTLRLLHLKAGEKRLSLCQSQSPCRSLMPGLPVEEPCHSKHTRHNYTCLRLLGLFIPPKKERASEKHIWTTAKGG